MLDIIIFLVVVGVVYLIHSWIFGPIPDGFPEAEYMDYLFENTVKIFIRSILGFVVLFFAYLTFGPR